ncbi:hypothetical protein POUND7_011247 [Theobroma cacao]
MHILVSSSPNGFLNYAWINVCAYFFSRMEENLTHVKVCFFFFSLFHRERKNSVLL